MTHPTVEFGPRLIGEPAGALRAAALVRPTESIERAKPGHGEPGAIFVRAAEQFAVLARTLAYFDVSVTEVETGDDPYCCALTDTAVLFESGAMLMRPTSMTRRPEVERLSAAFAGMDVPLTGRVTAPGLLDGTDIVLADRTAFVGVGARGNAMGRAGFTQIARSQGFDVVEVTLAAGVSSLQSVLGVLGPGLLVVAQAKTDPATFEGFQTVVLELGEDSAAGVICLGDRHVIADVRYRTALQRMRRAGVTVEGIDLYEFEKVGITPSMLVLPLHRA